jgi:hypothetical protein
MAKCLSQVLSTVTASAADEQVAAYASIRTTMIQRDEVRARSLPRTSRQEGHCSSYHYLYLLISRRN